MEVEAAHQPHMNLKRIAAPHTAKGTVWSVPTHESTVVTAVMGVACIFISFSGLRMCGSNTTAHRQVHAGWRTHISPPPF